MQKVAKMNERTETNFLRLFSELGRGVTLLEVFTATGNKANAAHCFDVIEEALRTLKPLILGDTNGNIKKEETSSSGEWQLHLPFGTEGHSPEQPGAEAVKPQGANNGTAKRRSRTVR